MFACVFEMSSNSLFLWRIVILKTNLMFSYLLVKNNRTTCWCLLVVPGLLESKWMGIWGRRRRRSRLNGGTFQRASETSAEAIQPWGMCCSWGRWPPCSCCCLCAQHQCFSFCAATYIRLLPFTCGCFVQIIHFTFCAHPMLWTVGWCALKDEGIRPQCLIPILLHKWCIWCKGYVVWYNIWVL